MADEFAQYKTAIQAPAGDEFAQYKVDPTAHIGVNRGPQTSSPGYQYSTGYASPNDAPRASGGFWDRVSSAASDALQHPGNFLPSWKDVIFPGASATEQSYQEFKNAKAGAPAPDPAAKLGSMFPAAIGALVTHAADPALGTTQPYTPPSPRVPGWKQAGVTPTEPGFNWQGSTPEEIKAQLSRMANRAQAVRAEGQSAESFQEQNIPVKGVNTPAAQGQPAGLPPMQPVQSTTIAQHGYDPASQQMYMQFKNGNIYRYSGVPQKVFDQYAQSESQGSFHASQIKGRYQTDLVGKVKPTK